MAELNYGPDFKFENYDKPLSERTLKYGRNILAVCGAIILIWFLGFDLKKAELFGLAVKDAEAGLIRWAFLLVIAYYWLQFLLNCLADWNKFVHGPLILLRAYRKRARGQGKDSDHSKRWAEQQRMVLIVGIKTVFFDIVIPICFTAAAICIILWSDFTPPDKVTVIESSQDLGETMPHPKKETKPVQ